MATYIAYNYGKMNQSYAMKNENNEIVFEANLIKFHLFSECDYEFVNKKTLKTEKHKVGKTRTNQMGIGSISLTTSSYFKLDGRNVFDTLERKGYHFSFKAKHGIMHPEFALVDKDGNEVANYKLNVRGERQESVMGIGHYQMNTVITTDSTDLDAIFLGAFILSRVDLSTNLR